MSKSRLTHEQFLERAIKIHGDTFNYLTKYKKSTELIKVQCKKCTYTYELKAGSHLKKGAKCSVCSGYRMNRETFLEKSFKVHGDTFIYLDDYVNSKTLIKMVCKKCDYEFSRLPQNHLDGDRCGNCTGVRRKTHEEFLAEADEIHNGKYTYLTEYVNAKAKMKIQCGGCGDVFEQAPNTHLYGSGCTFCNKGMRTHDLFERDAREVHGDKYSYLTKFVIIREKIKILCNLCGHIFYQLPRGHLLGKGCMECGGCRKLTNYEFLKRSQEIHGDKFIYLDEYVNGVTPIRIECKSCGHKFSQKGSKHLEGIGCFGCNISKSERLFYTALKKTQGENIQVERNYKANWLLNPETRHSLELDFYFPKLKLAFEVQGLQHYKSIEYFGGLKTLEGIQRRDRIKKKLCKDHGVTLIEYDLRLGKTLNHMISFLEDYFSAPSEPAEYVEPKILKAKTRHSTHKRTHEEFLERSHEIHGDKFTYLSKYESAMKKMKMKCNTCGYTFLRSPVSHDRGHDCAKCLGLVKTPEEFLKDARRVHGDKFTYLEEYEKSLGKIKIKCNTCNTIFRQTPNSHLQGKGCLACYLEGAHKKPA